MTDLPNERYGHNQIDTEHILLALIEQPGGVIPQILENLNINAQALTERLDQTLRMTPKANIFGGGAGQIFITPRVKRIIDLANEEANKSLTLRPRRVTARWRNIRAT